MGTGMSDIITIMVDQLKSAAYEEKEKEKEKDKTEEKKK